MQETASELSHSFVGGSLSGCGVRQINSVLVPDELILRAQVEVVAGHHGRSPVAISRARVCLQPPDLAACSLVSSTWIGVRLEDVICYHECLPVNGINSSSLLKLMAY